MVFRGGFGITTVDLFTTDLNQNFEEYTSNVTVQNAPAIRRPAFYLSQGPGPVNFTFLANGTSPSSAPTAASRTATRYDPNLRNPYAMNWNALYQYQFASDVAAEFSYQGSAGVGLLEEWNINTVPLNISTDPGSLKPHLPESAGLQPYPEFRIVNMWSNFGHSTYHSGTVKLEKRFHLGLTLTSFYTFSKAIDDCDNDWPVHGRDLLQPQPGKGPCRL